MSQQRVAPCSFYFTSHILFPFFFNTVFFLPS